MQTIFIIIGFLMLLHGIHQQPIDLEWMVDGAVWWVFAICWK